MTTGSIPKRGTALADGRELIYFDDADTTLGPERSFDARILDPQPATATMRQDVLTGDWVSIAAALQNRTFTLRSIITRLRRRAPGTASRSRHATTWQSSRTAPRPSDPTLPANPTVRAASMTLRS